MRFLRLAAPAAGLLFLLGFLSAPAGAVRLKDVARLQGVRENQVVGYGQSAAVKLGPASTDKDFTFALGYGFGYAFSPRFGIDLVQDVTTVWHQKDGLAAGDDSSTRIQGTRVVGRLGLGG